jgi:rRNA processing protein Gar1
MEIIKCDRCGRRVNHGVIIRSRHSVGIVNSVFGITDEDFLLCRKCTTEFDRWVKRKRN